MFRIRLNKWISWLVSFCLSEYADDVAFIGDVTVTLPLKRKLQQGVRHCVFVHAHVLVHSSRMLFFSLTRGEGLNSYFDRRSEYTAFILTSFTQERPWQNALPLATGRGGATETEHGPVSVTSQVRADCQSASWSKSKEEVWWDRHGYQGIYDQKPAEEAAVSAVTFDLWLYLTNVTFSDRCISFLRKALVFEKVLIMVWICASLWTRVSAKPPFIWP